MLKIDTTGFTELAKKYETRASNCKSMGVSGITPTITKEVSKVFLDMLMAGEKITLDEQKKHYAGTNRGFYGTESAGHQMEMVNPQEKIDPSNKPLGHGRFYADRFYTIGNNNTSVSLATRATMRPYPNTMDSKGLPTAPIDLPEMPIMYYFRRGWKDPNNPKHHMKPRPFGNMLAQTINALKIFANMNDKLLLSWDFKRK